MVRAIGLWLPCILVAGCAHHSVEPLDLQSFAFEARASRGEIWVMAPLAMHDPIEMSEQHLLGAALPLTQRPIRARRTQEVASLPDAIARALPGEVNARLGASWSGQFRHQAMPPDHAERLGNAVAHRRPDLHAVLEGYAQAVERWVLLTWVTELDAEPLVQDAWPGEIVETSAGSVVVDLDDDPHIVSVKLGTALLSPDGEVVLRYEDRFDAVLTGDTATSDAARHLARALAAEITRVWVTEGGLIGSW